MQKKEENLMDKIVSLCKRRGFVYPGSEIYGGMANSWDYGPLGTTLKNNIKQNWWEFFVEKRGDMYGLDAALIMNPKVWQASGHLENFSDPLVECKKCHSRFREDGLEGVDKCPACGAKESFTEGKMFNLMFKTFIGPAEDISNVAYFRPETAQAMFVNFKNILDSYSPKLPFGMAQIGKAFRNEITPGNFIFRTREFEQMEIEYFIKPTDDWNEVFEKWLLSMKEWMRSVGMDMKKVSDYEVSKNDLAHYSKRTIDIEFEFPFGKKELFGLAYRTDFDLKKHQEASGQSLEYFDEETKEKYIPHVIEPSLGVDRALLAILSSAYKEEEIKDGEKRVYLDLDIKMAPFKVAVFPLMANKSELVEKAKEIYNSLMSASPFMGPIAFDGGGNVGKRYRKQDEIGTPYCLTIDFQTLEDDTVTVRDRNTMNQERMKVEEIESFLRKNLK